MCVSKTGTSHGPPGWVVTSVGGVENGWRFCQISAQASEFGNYCFMGLYFASVELREMDARFYNFYELREVPNKIKKLLVDGKVSRHVPRLESLKVCSSNEEEVDSKRPIPRSFKR